MFKDCLEVFNKYYSDKGDRYILDGYSLSEGTYILVGQDMQISKVLEVVKQKGKEAIDETLEGYDEFCYMDYYSYYLESNKCVDSAKLIHSNNYLSFMVKKESITSGKLQVAHITKHYYLLAHPEEKYKSKKKSLELYQEVEKQIGPIDMEKLVACEQWIQEHLFTLLSELELKSDKGYLKIFFEPRERTLFEQESRRYIIPNIYNATDYNVVIEGEIYGMPNDNLGLNSKKPYLKHMGRKNSVPYLIDTQEVLLQKKFMDILKNEAAKGHYNIYLSEDNGIIGLDNKRLLSKEDCSNQEFTGYFLRIDYGDKGLLIVDNDYIPRYTPTLKGFYIKRSLPMTDYDSEKGLTYGGIETLAKAAQMINNCFFKGFLSQSYFGQLPDKLKENVLQEAIIRSREAFFMWFYKGKTEAIKQVFGNLSLALIKYTIMSNEDLKAQKFVRDKAKEQWMLRDAVNVYLNTYLKEETQGGICMGDQLQPIFTALEEKVMGRSEAVITCDLEYFCAVGQIAYYLLSQNKGSKKTHALLNPILNAKEDSQIKEQLRRLFVKYNYNIPQGAGRFNRLYAMITAYVPEKNILQDALLYGYLQDNLLYKSSKNEVEAVENVEMA